MGHPVGQGQPRRFLDLKVKEVSFVDEAAILREFLVVKRRKPEDPMGAFAADTETNGDDVNVAKNADGDVETSQDNAPPELTEAEITKAAEELGDMELGWSDWSGSQVEVEKQLPADLKTAITAVVGWMKKMAKGPGAPTAAIMRVATFLSKVAGGKYPYPKPAGKAQHTGKPEYPGMKTQKSADGGGDQPAPAIQVFEDGSVKVAGQSVMKGKQFTAGRVNTVKEVVAQLAGLLGDVDKDALKAVLEGTNKADLPKDVAWQQGTFGVPTKKALEEALEPVQKAIEGLGERVESIEKARKPSSSADEGDTDVKTQKSLWTGIL